MATTPVTMKAMTVTKLGEFEDIFHLDEEAPRPTIKKPTELLIRVLACSISPGDSRRVHGDIDAVFNPKAPFIPGCDVCGLVEEAGAKATFKTGDCVAACNGTFEKGMAEFCVVDSSLAQIKPTNVSAVEASTLPNSALRALLTVEMSKLKGSERVLVIGASGGFGTFLVQLLRDAGVSYIAAVSSQDELLRSLGVDRVINYQQEGNDWSQLPEFESEPFDIIFDCVGGLDKWPLAKKSKALKSRKEGGTYFAVAMHDPVMIVKSYAALGTLMGGMLGRTWANKVHRSVPKYSQLLLDGTSPTADLTRLFKLVEEGKLKVVQDAASPFPFTSDGCAKAFRLQYSRHAHGKIVVKIADEPVE